MKNSTYTINLLPKIDRSIKTIGDMISNNDITDEELEALKTALEALRTYRAAQPYA